MTFKSKTGVQPRSFTQGTANRRPIRPISMRVEVTGYDIPDRPDAIGVLFGKRINDGKEVEIAIKSEKVDSQLARLKADPNKKADAGSFHGALINADMRKEIEPGAWVVVENAVFQKNHKVGETSRQVYEANWIHACPAASDDKVIEGVMTSDAPTEGRTNNIQVWSKPLSVKDNADEIEKLIADYNDRAANWDPDARLPRHGFRLRTIVRKGETKEIFNVEEGKKVPTEVAEVLSRTYPLEWVYERGDEQGAPPKQNRPISGEDLADDINGYMDYIAERFADVSHDVEVMPYKSYFTSRTHTSFRINEFGPLKDMATTPIQLEANVPGEDPEEPKVGKNYGVYGILILIDDKIERVKGNPRPQITEQFMAQKFFGNARSYSNELDTMIRAADGVTPVVTPEELGAPRRKPREEGAPRAASQADQRAAAANSVSGGFDDFAQDDNPFETGSDTEAQATFGNVFATDGFDGADAATEDAAGEAGDTADTSKTEAAPAPAPTRSFGRR